MLRYQQLRHRSYHGHRNSRERDSQGIKLLPTREEVNRALNDGLLEPLIAEGEQVLKFNIRLDKTRALQREREV